MTADKELLKLAAKAAGIELHQWVESCNEFMTTNSDGWNPLTNDGDALRLAVTLGLFTGAEFYHFRSLERFAGQDVDEYTATRRAIVRAAAEIGRAMT